MNSHFSQLVDRPSSSTATSIKRSFDQFGLDLDNTLIGSTSRPSNDSNRTKRARSNSVEAESSTGSSGSIRSRSSLGTALSSLVDEDTSMEIVNEGRSGLSVNRPSSPRMVSIASAANSPAEPGASNSSSDLPLDVQDIDMLAPGPFLSPWRRSPPVEDSFEIIPNNTTDFERHISVLREPPARTLSPMIVPYTSIVDYPEHSRPETPQIHSEASPRSWGSDSQQEQHSDRVQYRQRTLESEDLMDREIASLHESLHRSPSSPRPEHSHRHSSHSVRLPLPRLNSESASSTSDRRPRPRSSLAHSLSLRILGRGHSDVENVNRPNAIDYNDSHRQRINFLVDRGHLPSFARHFENLLPDIDYTRPFADFESSVDREWNESEDLSFRSRRQSTNSLTNEPARSSWFSTRPTPSNTLMSESTEQHRRRIQRQIMNSMNGNNSFGNRSASERLDARSRNLAADDIDLTQSPTPHSHRYSNSNRMWDDPSETMLEQVHGSPQLLYPLTTSTTVRLNTDDPELISQHRNPRTGGSESVRSGEYNTPLMSFDDFMNQGDNGPLQPMVEGRGRASLLPAARPAIFRSPSSSPPSAPRLPSVPASRFQSPLPIHDHNSSGSIPEPHRSNIYRDINLNAYQPGPFRASLERFREIDRMRYNLRSQLDQLESIVGNELPTRVERERTRERERERTSATDYLHSEHPRERSDSQFTRFPVPHPEFESSRSSRRRDWDSLDEMPTHRSPTPTSIGSQGPTHAHRGPMLSDPAHQTTHFRRRPSVSHRPYSDHVQPGFLNFPEHHARERARDRRVMDELFTRRPRMEGSRIDDDLVSSLLHHAAPPIPAADSQSQSFHQAMEVLRGDGLSSVRQQQLIDRFHQDRSQESRRSSSSLRGEIEQRENDSMSRRANVMRRSQIRRDPPAFFGNSRPTSNSRGARYLTQRSPSNSPTRGTVESGMNGRSSRSGLNRRAGRFASDFEGYLRFDYPRFDLLDIPSRSRHSWRLRNLGDYVRDEDFDDSFESLMNLTATLGEVKPKNTPDYVIGMLPSGIYRDWATPGCDQRCPICLDDYQPTDPVLKISDCSHWLHKDCLEQWLRSANTCPVCRKRVKGKRRRANNNEEPLVGPSVRGDDRDDNDNNHNNGNRTDITNTNTIRGGGSRNPWLL